MGFLSMGNAGDIDLRLKLVLICFQVWIISLIIVLLLYSGLLILVGASRVAAIE